MMYVHGELSVLIAFVRFNVNRWKHVVPIEDDDDDDDEEEDEQDVKG